MLLCPQNTLANYTVNQQLEAPLLTFFSRRVFRISALAQNFAIDPISSKPDMGSLLHSREGGYAAAIFVSSFESELIAEVRKWVKTITWLQTVESDVLVPWPSLRCCWKCARIILVPVPSFLVAFFIFFIALSPATEA